MTSPIGTRHRRAPAQAFVHRRTPTFVLPGLARDCITCRLHFAFVTRPLKAICLLRLKRPPNNVFLQRYWFRKPLKTSGYQNNLSVAFQPGNKISLLLNSLKKTIKAPGYQKPYSSPPNLSSKNIPPLPPDLISLLSRPAIGMRGRKPVSESPGFSCGLPLSVYPENLQRTDARGITCLQKKLIEVIR